MIKSNGGDNMGKLTKEDYESGWLLLEAVSKLSIEDKLQLSMYVRALSDRHMLEQQRDLKLKSGEEKKNITEKGKEEK